MRLSEISSPKTGTFYYSKGEKLPEDMVKLFTQLAHAQRSGPEGTMLQIQKKYPGAGFIRHHIEHLGDLIHGFADSVQHDGIVRDLDRKVSMALNSFGTSLQGNLSDFQKSMEDDAKSKNVDVKELYKGLSQDLEVYVEGHLMLPSYNEVHLLCKKITTTLGTLSFEELLVHLKQLHSILSSPDKALKHAWTITRDKSGQIKTVG